MSDTQRRAAIATFLSQWPHGVSEQPVFADATDAPGALITVAGCVPYRRTPQGVEVCLMRPRGSKPELGRPAFELCKGTRMWQLPSGEWVDLKHPPFPTEGMAEPLLTTALREGMEEIGMPLAGIISITALGVAAYRSVSSARAKHMALFALHLHPEAAFTAPDAHAADTDEVRWWGVEEALASAEIREDHREVLGRIKIGLFTNL